MNRFENQTAIVTGAGRGIGEAIARRLASEGAKVACISRSESNSAKVAEAISDLETLTEFTPDDWTMHYDGKTSPFSRETFDRLVPLSPKEYRQRKESDLNEMRAAAGLDTVQVFERERDIRQLQSAAGI